MTSQVEKLNATIEQAESALAAAKDDASRARERYRNALATGDDKAAQEAQEAAQDADQQAQRESDRITVLQDQLVDAEHADNLPAFESAEADVHAAIDAENKIHTRLAKALDQVATLRDDVAAAHMATHQAIRTAKRQAEAAHLPMPRYQRQRLSELPELKSIGKIRELVHVGAYQNQLIHNEIHG